jgi:hypothetical protein
MIAIIITEQIKSQNKLRGAVGSIRIYNKYPNKFWVTENIIGGYFNRFDLHEIDGFRNVVEVEYDENTHTKGLLIFDEDNDVFTYHVTPKSNLKLKEEKLDKYIKRREFLIEKRRARREAIETQELNDEDSLENQDLFPMWDENDIPYQIGVKVLAFNDEDELILYRSIKGHRSKKNRNPKNTENLFEIVE